MCDGRDVAERRHRVSLAAAEEVGAFWELVRPVSIFVQPVRQEGCDWTHGTHVVAGWFPIAKVELVQLVTSHRKVDGGRLVRVEVHGVRVGILLRWHCVVVLH